MVSKALIGGMLGVSSVGGLGTWYLLKGDGIKSKKEVTSISEIIQEQGERFILSVSTDTHNTQWDALIQAYTPLITNNSDNKTLIKEFSKKIPSRDELKQWCKDNAKKDHKLKGEFNAFKEWCTKDNMSQHIRVASSGPKRILLTLDDAEWNNKKSSYNGSADGDKQITDSSGVKIAKDQLQDIGVLKNWCFKNAKGLYVSDTEPSFIAYKEWCTKDSVK